MIDKIVRVLNRPAILVKFFKKRIHRVYENFYAWHDANSIQHSVKSGDKVLFVDGGSNIGQGFAWFSRYFNSDSIHFDLFEPNPNCIEILIDRIEDSHLDNISIHSFGLGLHEEELKFYGISEAEGGATSQGGSINKDHNSMLYSAHASDAIIVKTIDFSEYLKNKKREYSKIVVKMDIEGAENDLLEHLISQETHKLIDILYIEFHSQFLNHPQSHIERKREVKIINKLKRDKIKVRIWH